MTTATDTRYEVTMEDGWKTTLAADSPEEATAKAEARSKYGDKAVSVRKCTAEEVAAFYRAIANLGR